MCQFFKSCPMHGTLLSVVFRNFSIDIWLFWKSRIIISLSIIHMSTVFWIHIGTFVLWLPCAGCSTSPPLTSKLYWLYSVPLISILSSYLLHLSFSLPFLFTIIVSVLFSLVLASFLSFMLRHHCLYFYQNSTFVWTSVADLGLFVVSL